MTDHPRERDVRVNRLRQLNEPYPNAVAVVDQIVAQKAEGAAVPEEVEETDYDYTVGLKTGVPSNYEASLGGEPKSLTAFEVKKPPGRL